MKLTSIQTFVVGNPWKNWVFLKLHTDEGVHGVGEATVHRKAKMAEAALIEAQRYFLESDPFDLEAVNAEMIRSGVPAFARAAVDMACWDIIGKVVDQPVCRLIGGRNRSDIPAYANGWYQVDRTPEAFATAARKVRDGGYRAMKFDPFGSAHGALSNAELRLSIDIVAAVREAVGPEVDLFIEAHGRFDTVLGVRIARLLEPYDPGWLEEPVRSPQIDDLAAIAARSPVPIAAGEGLTSKEAFLELLNRRAAQVIQPDPTTAGGITETKKVCAIAEAHHVRVAPHNAQGPVCTAACLHLGAAIPGIVIQETFEEYATPLAAQIVDRPIRIENGCLLVPDGAGLGLDLIEEEMARHPYDESHFLDLYGKGGWEKRNLGEPPA